MTPTVSELFDLTNRVAFITGAAGHLGSQMAEALAEAGAKVYLNGRTESAVTALRDKLTGKGLKAEACAFDITDKAALDQFFATLKQTDGRLDIIVNNAYSGRTGTLAKATEADYSEAHLYSVTLPAMIVQKADALLKAAVAQAGGASVINIASMYGMVSPDPAIYGDSGFNNPPWYGAAKGGLIQWSRYAACHLAKDGIRVNAISPGPFPPETLAVDLPDFHAKLCAKTPMGRTGRASELKGVVLFLASDAASFVTGATIPVDGGWTAW